MRRADQHYQSVRPPVSARDQRCISTHNMPVNDQIGADFELEHLLAERPELTPVVRGILSVAIQLTMMLPRLAIEHFVDAIVQHLDRYDGDPDTETTDDREPDDLE